MTVDLSGVTTDLGDVVQIVSGGVVLGSASVGASATSVTVPLNVSLSEGANTLTARIVDRAGNVGTASAALVITVDTTAPTASTPQLAVASDSGTVGDGLTNDTTPALTGTGTAGETVTVYDGATAVGTATVDGSGAWALDTSALANGAHSLTVVLTDSAGNASVPSSPLVLTIDASAPVAANSLAISPDIPDRVPATRSPRRRTCSSRARRSPRARSRSPGPPDRPSPPQPPAPARGAPRRAR